MSFEKEEEHYLYELKVNREMFYNEDDMWGVFSFQFVNKEDQKESGVELNPRYGTFVVSGKAPKMKPGQIKHVAFMDKFSEKYGDGYEFLEVKSEGLTTAESQKEFLREVINENNANKIIEHFSPITDTFLKDISEGKIDLTEVKGIGDKYAEGYLDKISKYEEYQVAIYKLAPLGAGISTIERLVDHFKSVSLLLEVLDSNVYKVTEVSGFGFRRVDELALKLGYEKDSKERLVAGAEYVLTQMSSYGDIKIPVEEFDAEMCKILEVPEITDDIFQTIMSDYRFDYNDGSVCLERLRKEEEYIAHRVTELIQKVKPFDATEEEIEKVIKRNEEALGFTFNKEQRAAIQMVLDNGFSVINGRGGSGKSSVVKTIVDIFGANKKSSVAMALSGKASNVLIQNGVVNAGTIHRKLGWVPGGGFSYNKFEPLPYDLIIVDEFSMVNNTLVCNIIEAVDAGARLLLVGDNGQLPPIGHGAAFETLLKLNVPRVELVKVHRQAQQSGILTTANKIREHEQINSYGTKEVQVLGELKDMRVFNYIDKTEIYDDIMTTVTAYRDNPNTKAEDLQVLTAMKRGALGVPTLNEGLQNLLNPHPLRGDKKPFILSKGVELRVGDRVIQNGNLYDAVLFNIMADYKGYIKFADEEAMDSTDVFNGTIGYIVDANDLGLLVEFDTHIGKQLVFYAKEGEKKPIGMLDLAYAITTHRSQGSGFKTVLFTFDYSAYMLLSKEFVYTGITRAIDNCLMFVENTALHHAIKNTHSGNRKTYLYEYLEEALEDMELPV